MRSHFSTRPVVLAGVLLAAGACDVVPFLGEGPAAREAAAGSSGGTVSIGGDASEPSDLDVRVMDAYLNCLDTCTTGVVQDRATCRLACASSSLDDVPDLTAGAKACMLPCLETLARCSLTCEVTPTPPDDERACELRCESAGSVCLSHCVDQNE